MLKNRARNDIYAIHVVWLLGWLGTEFLGIGNFSWCCKNTSWRLPMKHTATVGSDKLMTNPTSPFSNGITAEIRKAMQRQWKALLINPIYFPETSTSDKQSLSDPSSLLQSSLPTVRPTTSIIQFKPFQKDLPPLTNISHRFYTLPFPRSINFIVGLGEVDDFLLLFD